MLRLVTTVEEYNGGSVFPRGFSGSSKSNRFVSTFDIIVPIGGVGGGPARAILFFPFFTGTGLSVWIKKDCGTTGLFFFIHITIISTTTTSTNSPVTAQAMMMYSELSEIQYLIVASCVLYRLFKNNNLAQNFVEETC